MTRKLQTCDIYHIGDLLANPKTNLDTIDLSGNYMAMLKGFSVLIYALRKNQKLSKLVVNDTVLSADGVFQPIQFLLIQNEAALR